MSTSDNCTLDNGYNGEDNYLLREFDMSIVCNVLIETKNPFMPNIKILIGIPFFDFQIDEFQILFLIFVLSSIYYFKFSIFLFLSVISKWIVFLFFNFYFPYIYILHFQFSIFIHTLI